MIRQMAKNLLIIVIHILSASSRTTMVIFNGNDTVAHIYNLAIVSRHQDSIPETFQQIHTSLRIIWVQVS